MMEKEKAMDKAMEMNKAFNSVYGQLSTAVGWHANDAEEIKVIVDTMDAHCKKMGIDCSKDEIQKYVNKNLDEMKKGYADFMYQTKMMN